MCCTRPQPPPQQCPVRRLCAPLQYNNACATSPLRRRGEANLPVLYFNETESQQRQHALISAPLFRDEKGKVLNKKSQR
jgi:adenine-specific DNA glycosylase